MSGDDEKKEPHPALDEAFYCIRRSYTSSVPLGVSRTSKPISLSRSRS
jgi:hypothetical protein